MKITKFNNINKALEYINKCLGGDAYNIINNQLYYGDGSFNDKELCPLNIKGNVFYTYADDEISFITDNKQEIIDYLYN